MNYKPTRKERAWAARSPAYVAGDRVKVYRDEEPGAIVGPSPRYLGHWIVKWDSDSHTETVQWDNIVREGEKTPS